MGNDAFQPGHIYTPSPQPDGETAYTDSVPLQGGVQQIDTPTTPLQGNVDDFSGTPNAVNDDFSNDDPGPQQSCPVTPQVPVFKSMIPKLDKPKKSSPVKLTATKTQPPDPPLTPQTATSATPQPSQPPKQATITQTDPGSQTPQTPQTPLQKLNAFFDPISTPLRATDTFIDKWLAPHIDMTKPGEGVRAGGLIVATWTGGRLFSWLGGKFGPSLPKLLPRVLKPPTPEPPVPTPGIPEPPAPTSPQPEEQVWVTKSTGVIHRVGSRWVEKSIGQWENLSDALNNRNYRLPKAFPGDWNIK